MTSTPTPNPTPAPLTTPFQARIDRDVIAAVGPDAATFLQGQLSQDVASMSVGTSAYSLLLQPQGKVDAWLRVSRTGDESFLLDVEGGWADAVLTRLNRFKLRTKCELTELDGWICWAVRGLSAPAATDATAIDTTATDDTAVIIAGADWPGQPGFDRLGVELAPLDGIPVVDTDRYVEARVAAGVAALGHELDESTIPAEAGRWLIEVSVSFTKGCYTGQELVARVDSRGSNTPRHLRSLRAEGGLRAGMAVELDGAVVGEVTSAGADGTAALGYLKRSVEVPAEVMVGGRVATAQALPGG